MNLKLLLVFMLIVPILWRDVEAIEPCKISTRKYYSSIEQKLYPPHPTPSHQQSEIWAKKQEEIGGAYYIADYCENGDIISLSKHLYSREEYRYDYIYESGKLIAVDYSDERGKRRNQPNAF